MPLVGNATRTTPGETGVKVGLLSPSSNLSWSKVPSLLAVQVALPSEFSASVSPS
jgi:hypothetical protein